MSTTAADVPGPVHPLDEARKLHVQLTLLLTLFLMAVLLMSGPISLRKQIILMVVGVSLIGIPHGAMDHRVAEQMLQIRMGRLWGLAFVAAYLSLVLFVILAWLLNPIATLIAFLVVSILHFGLGEAEAIDGDAVRLGRYVSAIANGILPVGLPILFHPNEVTVLFNWLMPGDAGIPLSGMTAALIALRFILIPAVLWIFVDAVRRRSWLAICEWCVLSGVYILLPPLLGFSIYFCLWHSPRHLIHLAWWRGENTASLSSHVYKQTSVLKIGFRRLAMEAVPLTVLALAGMSVAAIYLLPSLGVNRTAVRVIFIALSALTVPHMILTAWAEVAIPISSMGVDVEPVELFVKAQMGQVGEPLA